MQLPALEPRSHATRPKAPLWVGEVASQVTGAASWAEARRSRQGGKASPAPVDFQTAKRPRLRPLFQPIFRRVPGTLELAGIEGALAGPPGSPMAEPEALYQQALSRGQVAALDLAALETLLPQATRLVPRLPLHLRIHASTLQLRAEAIHERLRQAGAGITGSYEHLTLEIVLRGCALGPLEIGSTLISLQRMGATLALNDPWQAPAALLESFPTQLWRFGSSLIHGLAQDPRRRALLEVLLGLARRKQIPILAAGVRRPEDLRILFDLGIDRVQGDLLCPALSPLALRARLGGDGGAAY